MNAPSGGDALVRRRRDRAARGALHGALRALVRTEATVRRDRRVLRVPADDLVPGDVILLEGGDVVSADLRLFAASKLQANEAALTGESLPVEKRVEPVAASVIARARQPEAEARADLALPGPRGDRRHDRRRSETRRPCARPTSASPWAGAGRRSPARPRPWCSRTTSSERSWPRWRRGGRSSRTCAVRALPALVRRERDPRGGGRVARELTRNPWVWAALALCAALLLSAAYAPGLRALLDVHDPGWRGWSVVAGLGALPTLALQLRALVAPRERARSARSA